MKRSVLTTILVLLLLPFQQEKNHAAYNDDSGYKAAADLLNKGLYLEALGMYQEIVIHSDNARNKAKALLYMGNIYSLFLDRYDDALNQFRKVINEHPESPEARDALFNSGMVLYEDGRFKDAYAYFSKYIQKYPDGLHKHSALIWADSAKARMHEKKSSSPSGTLSLESDAIIRVLVQETSNRITLHSVNPIKISDGYSGKLFYTDNSAVVIAKSGPYLSANGHVIKASRYRIESEGTIMLNGRRFRGIFDFVLDADRFQVVNHLPLEQYLYGVIPLEMSPRWPKAALMAQAVASRTYALYIKSKSEDKPFDVVATTASQVYGGFDREVNAATQAVDSTRGQVMIHNGKLIIAYFHANSGGYTEDAQLVWGVNLPYLKATPDRFSEQLPNNLWEYTLDFKELRNRLNQYGLNIGNIRTLISFDKTHSGRMRRIRILADNGSHTLESNAFRIKVDPTKMKSTLVQMESHNNAVFIRGKGYGHGVGMSQWGAKCMAEKGFNYLDILKHYYTDIEIVALRSS